MATLRFDGIDDWVRGTGQGALNGAKTFAFLMKRGGISTTQSLIGVNNSPNTFIYSVGFDFTNQLQAYSDGIYSVDSSSLFTDVTNWYVVVWTWTGSTTVLHRKRIDSGSWTHTAGIPTHAVSLTAAGGYVKLGNWDYTFGDPGSGDEGFNGDMALAAWWDGIAMTNTEVEELATNLETNDWWNHSVGQPDSLTELRDTTPVDEAGLMTWATATGATAAGGDPPGWTFGLGPPPPPPQVIRPDNDLATTGWTATPLFSKVNDESDATIITGGLS